MRGLSRTFRKYERRIYLVVTAFIAVGFFLTYESADYSSRAGRERVGTIAGKPVTRAEIRALAGRVELLAAMDAFSRSPLLSAIRSPWLGLLVQHKLAQTKPQSREAYMWRVYSGPYGLAAMEDLSATEAREKAAWKWLAYLRAADRAGIQVAPEELLEFVHDITPSRRRGQFGRGREEFDRDQYLHLVESGEGLRIPVEFFEQAAGEYLRVEKYFHAVGDAAVVPHQEVVDAFLDRHREVEIAYLGFDPQDFASAVTPPTRHAVADFFQDPARRSSFQIPAKVQVEYLLAEREAFAADVAPPSEPDIKTRYDAEKERKYKNPDGGRDGKPPYKPIEEVREQIAKDIRLERAAPKALEGMKKALWDIGMREAEIHRQRSGSLDLAAFAGSARAVRGVTHFFDADQAPEAEKSFGTFKQARDRQNFRRRLFGVPDERGQFDERDLMKDGDVMPGEKEPVATDKGWLIYRLVQRKPARVPAQLTSDVEEEIVRRLRRDATDRMAHDEALRWVETINAQGLEGAEARLGRKFHRPAAVQRAQRFPDPSGGPGDHPHAAEMVDEAFRMREQGKIGKAGLFDPGPEQAKFVVALVRALEARMDGFDAEQGTLRESLLRNRSEGDVVIPGKRQVLIDKERQRIEQEIRPAKPEAPEPSPAG